MVKRSMQAGTALSLACRQQALLLLLAASLSLPGAAELEKLGHTAKLLFNQKLVCQLGEVYSLYHTPQPR